MRDHELVPGSENGSHGTRINDRRRCCHTYDLTGPKLPAYDAPLPAFSFRGELGDVAQETYFFCGLLEGGEDEILKTSTARFRRCLGPRATNQLDAGTCLACLATDVCACVG